MKVITSLFVISLICIAGCSTNDTGVAPSEGSLSQKDYLPFEIGRTWTYTTVATNPSGEVEPGSIQTFDMRVIEMNQLIGGQPNSTVLKMMNATIDTQNIVVYAPKGKLWTYIAALGNIRINPGTYYLYYYPGDTPTVNLGVNEVLKFNVYDYYAGSYEIRRHPSAQHARATMLPNNVLQLEGLSQGWTSMTIGRVDMPDSMNVLIHVVRKAVGLGPSFAAWMPIWEASASNAERDFYKWDSTVSFNKLNGTTIRSRIVYRMSDRYLRDQAVSLGGTMINAEQHLVQYSINEIIDSIAAGTTYPIYSGLTYVLSWNLWAAPGIGWMKGEISTSGISGGGSIVGISGYIDNQGIFRGSFTSPRISYDNAQIYGNDWFESLRINTQDMRSGGTFSFSLVKKNF